MNYKVVNKDGNEATKNQIFGYIAYQMMSASIDQLIDAGKVTIKGEVFTIDEKALEKLEGMKNHIQTRWDNPIEAVKVVKKKADLEWSI